MWLRAFRAQNFPELLLDRGAPPMARALSPNLEGKSLHIIACIHTCLFVGVVLGM